MTSTRLEIVNLSCTPRPSHSWTSILQQLITPSPAAKIQVPEGVLAKCGHVCTTRDVLRAPLDLVIEGNNVWFARPLFNLDGTRVVGSEMATGTIDVDGKLHLSSNWSYLGNRAKGDYGGTLTRTGGTLTGTQTWSAPDGSASISRACTAALVPAGDAKHSAEEKSKP